MNESCRVSVSMPLALVAVMVSVLVPDSPGELARLLGDVGAAGVNLEDLQIEHAAGRPVGVAEISVLPGSAEHLQEVWIAVRASLRSVLEEVTLADLASGNMPSIVGDYVAEPDSWAAR